MMHASRIVALVLGLRACAGQGNDGSVGPKALPARADGVPSAALPRLSAAPTNAHEAGVPTVVTQPKFPARVVARDTRACAIFDNGSLQCWGGFNFDGELGVGHTETLNVPAWVLDLHGVTQLVLETHRTCATTEGGKLYCWGRPIPHEGLAKERNTRPVEVVGVTGASNVALGDNHACAVVSGGALVCWGNNDRGQLGLGQQAQGTSVTSPTKVPSLPPVAGVLAERNMTVAWSQSGELFVWGTIGDTNTAWSFASAHKVAGVSDVRKVFRSRDHVCALLADKQVRCFTHETLTAFEAGKEYDLGPELAALRTALAKSKLKPSKLRRAKPWVGGTVFPDGRGVSGVVDVAVFNHDASALTENGSVYSWGNPERGTIGHLPDTKGFLGPTKIDGVADAVAIAGGFLHRCVLDRKGEVACFGEGKAGRLGSADLRDAVSAVPVKGLPKIESIAANDHCTFAIGVDRKLYVWGKSWISACGIEPTEQPTAGPVVVPLASVNDRP